MKVPGSEAADRGAVASASFLDGLAPAPAGAACIDTPRPGGADAADAADAALAGQGAGEVRLEGDTDAAAEALLNEALMMTALGAADDEGPEPVE